MSLFHGLLLAACHVLLFAAARRTRSAYLLLLNLVFLFIVSGQVLYVLARFADPSTRTIQILRDTISRSGAGIAIVYYEIVLGLFTLFVYGDRWFLSVSGQPGVGLSRAHERPRSTRYGYITAGAVAGLALLYLSRVIGGFGELFSNARPANVPGATFPLLFIFTARLPVLRRIYYEGRVRTADVVLLVAILAILNLAGSRLLMVLTLLPVILLFLRRRRIQIGLRLAALGAVAALGILLVPQALKAWQGEEVSGNVFDVVGDTAGTLYSLQVEGISSVAGFVTRVEEHGLEVDGGLSLVSVLFRFVPSQLRAPFTDVDQALSSFYPHSQSIVPSGLQAGLAHFGPLAILILPAIWYFGFRLEQRKILGTTTNGSRQTMVATLLVAHLIALVRGSSEHFLFYLAADLVFSFVHMGAHGVAGILSLRPRRST